MAILQPVKPGLSAPIVTSIPDEWSKTWFRSFITNYLQNTDVRNAVTPSGGGVSVSSTGPFNPATLSLSPIPPDTVFGNVSGITAPPSALDETQLTSLIKVFSTAASGAVPKSPGGTLDFLRADGAWASAAAIPAPPSALVGLTPVDGTALTFMTSDSAPALDQSISPTWTGDHTFTQGVVLGTPVGGNLGPGTENVSNGYFVNGIRISTNGPPGKAGRDGRDGRFIVSGASGLSPSPILVQPAFGPQPKRAQDGHAGRIGPPGASTSAGGAVSSVTGTANQITASPTTGAVVLSFPANLINTTPASGIAVVFESAVTGSTSATAVLLIGGTAGATASQMLFCVQQNGFSNGFQVSTNGTNMLYSFINGNITVGAPVSGTALVVNEVAAGGSPSASFIGPGTVPLSIQELTAIPTGVLNAYIGIATAAYPGGSGINGDLVISPRTSQANFITLATNGANRVQITGLGNVTVTAPSSGVGLSVTGLNNANTVVVVGGSTTNQSFGIEVQAGTSSSDYAMLLESHSGTVLFEVFGDGGAVIGATTSGGDKGAGSINAQSYYLNGLLQTISLVTTSAETRTSTTTQTNSTSLTYAIPVAGTYAIRLVAYFTSIGTGGFAMGVNYSGSFTGTSSYIVYEECVQGTNIAVLTGEISSTPTAIVNDNATISTIAPTAIIVTATLTATGTGTLAMSFAQDVSNASASTLNIGSYMQVTRIA